MVPCTYISISLRREYGSLRTVHTELTQTMLPGPVGICLSCARKQYIIPTDRIV